MGMATEKCSESHGHLKQDQASRWRCPNKYITELLELSVVKREAAVFVAKLQHHVYSIILITKDFEFICKQHAPRLKAASVT